MRTKLGDLINLPGSKLLYEYDFGDGWQHELLLEEILNPDGPFQRCCVAGARRYPQRMWWSVGFQWLSLNVSLTPNTSPFASGSRTASIPKGFPYRK